MNPVNQLTNLFWGRLVCQVWNQAEDQVWDQIRDQLAERLWSPLGNLKSQLWNHIDPFPQGDGLEQQSLGV